MKDVPNITPEVISYLEKTFKPVTHTINTDIRMIDFKSGQFSVVEHLKQLLEKQKSPS